MTEQADLTDLTDLTDLDDLDDLVNLPYTGLSLDRAGGRRADQNWLDGLRANGSAEALSFWRDRCLTVDDRPLWRPAAEIDGDLTFLGLAGDRPRFACDLSTLDESDALTAAGATGSVDIRRLFGTVDAQTSATLAYARGLLHWHRNQRFCGACGSVTTSTNGGHVLVCAGCGKLLFPRIEPAVIVLVLAPGAPERCLLGRHRGSADNAYSTLAGFVEIGESLEDAVRREVFEEAGVRVGSVRYQGSQAWPFPSGLMIGFQADALSEDIDIDQDELVAARWFDLDEVVALRAEHQAAGTHRPDSIEESLVRGWTTSHQI